ncbi:unnamed protein product, partial [Sphacelaria rigidula]
YTKNPRAKRGGKGSSGQVSVSGGRTQSGASDAVSDKDAFCARIGEGDGDVLIDSNLSRLPQVPQDLDSK